MYTVVEFKGRYYVTEVLYMENEVPVVDKPFYSSDSKEDAEATCDMYNEDLP